MKATLYFFLLFLLAGCGIRETKARLDAAEAYMQARPDSALSILRSIDTTSLTSKALHARYALLHAMALDKNWIDTTDVGVVMSAVCYYDKHRPLANCAKPWYYLGRIQYNGRSYDDALISFLRAKDYAEKLNDDRFKSLIFLAISDTYNMGYLFEESLCYAQIAYDYALQAKDTTLANAALFSVALLQNNLKNYAEADTLFNQLLSSNHNDSHNIPSILNAYAQVVATYEKNYDKSVALFEQALAQTNSLNSINSWGSYAYCLYKIGEKEKSSQVFLKLEQAGFKDHFAYQIWKSRVEQLEGDYRLSFDLLEGAVQEQTEGVMKLLRQSAIKAQRDYLSLQNDTLKKENQLKRWIILLLTLFALAAAGSLYVLFRRHRDRIQQKNQQLMEIVQELVEQQQAVKVLTDKIEQTRRQQTLLRQEYFHLNQENYKELSELCNTYFRMEGKSSQANFVCGEVRALLKNLGVVDNNYGAFEQRVNEIFDQIMQHFRNEHPGHRELYFQTVCFLFAGFKNRTIALLLHLSEQDVYQTRWRVRTEIEKTPSSHQNDFKVLLDGRYPV